MEGKTPLVAGEDLLAIRRFMIFFMQADLRPARPAMHWSPRGWGHGRWFSLRPVSKTELSSAEFNEWTDSCTYTETPTALMAGQKTMPPAFRQKD